MQIFVWEGTTSGPAPGWVKDRTNFTEGNVMLKMALVIGMGAAAWYWRKELGSMLETQFPGMGEKTARTLDEAGRSAERFYEQATSRVSNT